MGEAGVLFREYMGKGFVLILFFAAVLYLFVAEKNKSRRILFVYMPITVLIVFFNPLIADVLMKVLDNEIYYRLLWLLPVTTVLSYTVSVLYGKLPSKYRLPYVIGVAVIVISSGSFIYSNPNFSKAENIYHVPEELVEICDVLEAEDTEHESYAIFPGEYLQYVRQYSGNIVLQYGREVMVERWSNYDEIYEAMEEKPVDIETISGELKKFLVIPKDKVGDEGFDWLFKVYESEHYAVYVPIYWKNQAGKFPYAEDPDYPYW